METVSRAVAAGITTAVIALGGAGIVLSLRLGVGTPAQPGPGLWPLVAASIVTVCAALLMVTEKSTADYERFGSRAPRVAGAIASLVVFAAVVELLGMPIASGLLMLYWLRALGGQSWLVSLSVAIAGPAVAYALFVSALGVQLPVWPYPGS